MKLFDSHAHLDFEPLSTEKAEVVERAYKAGVERILNVGTSVRKSEEAAEIADMFPIVYAAVGIHPHDAEVTVDVESAVEKIRELAAQDKVVAIGEIGLDFFVPQGEDRKVDKVKQTELFEAQLALAAELGKPVIVHTRDAEEETLSILKNFKLKIKNSDRIGVIHCYTSGSEFAKKLLNLGFSIGFTGFVTFEQPKFDHIREAVKVVPMERLLIETDAPFLAPEPYRGKTNEPAFVAEVAKKIADLKDLTAEEVAEKTFSNAEKLFLSS
jgi:TatD DNase family protein